mmetsp:Transcript_22961/g.52519  ORF Transcript_22961/g.52519 Transcript_22961/m.52519 type:complete len:929 (-) Transcript_22961:414-3200(-)|eukprot:CAMPEP_0197903160 /NCGR_PEP_ID=MMETSP1439-20131203/55241_1 /TAXON_ID=66791 /ORGANISM="Gonyaulax spinifera, Strain CCMP409" /LENGTH=928 /DNA_ID=CAMNT_0043524251 /DNA_START=59 /DNA_END=2845 /DNA_ORIENTATION=+
MAESAKKRKKKSTRTGKAASAAAEDEQTPTAASPLEVPAAVCSDAGDAEPSRSTKGRPRKKRRGAVPAATPPETGLEDAEEDCPGILLSDLVQGSASLDADSAAARPRRRKAKTRAGSSEARPVPEAGPGLSDGDSEPEADGSALRAAIDRLACSGSAESKGPGAKVQRAAPESEFHAGSMGEEVTMDDLLAPLAEGTGMFQVKQQLKGLAAMDPTPEPASEVKKTREERKVQYVASSKDVTKWTRQVTAMQKAEQVILVEDAHFDPTMVSLAAETEAVGDFEKELEAVTREAGTTEEALRGAQNLPMNPRIRDDEQIRQVARLKALMLREQQASKRVKKIKSKAYHRIHKKAEAKQREAMMSRLEHENPELAKALRVEFEKKHAETRMLRQRNSRKKWAQTMQRFAKGNKGAQKEISKQAQDAHDDERGLRRAIRGQRPDQSDDSEAAELSGSDSEDEGTRGGVVKDTVDKAQKLTVKEIKKLEQGGELPTTGLMGMPFMRQALLRKRESAKQEAQEVLKELRGLDRRLEGEEGSDGDSEEEPKAKKSDEGQGRDMKKFTPEELEAARKQVDEMFDNEDNAVECSVSGPLTVRGVPAADCATLPLPTSERHRARKGKRGAPAEKADDASATSPAIKPSPASATGSAPAKKAKSSAAAEVDNPWLTAGMSKPDDGTTKADKTADAAGAPGDSAASANPWVDPSTAGPSQKTQDCSARKSRAKKTKESEIKEAKERAREAMGDVLNVLNADSQAAQEQRDLVRTAFVDGTQEEDFEEEQEELARKKAADAAAEPEELAGWGHWTGEGAPKRKEKKPRPAAKPTATVAPRKAPVTFYEGENKAGAKYFIDQMPQSFETPEQYNRQLRMPSGPEWNPLPIFKEKIKPKYFAKVGAIVPPLNYVKHLEPDKQLTALEAYSSSQRVPRLKSRI